MIRISQIKLRPEQDIKKLQIKAAGILKINPGDIKALHIVRRSLDARKKPDVFYSYVVDVEVFREEKIMQKYTGKQAVSLEPIQYEFPCERGEKEAKSPVIVGMGPAGLFCGYFLAKAGYQPILLERGKNVEERQKDVEAFWAGGALNTESNVVFGEGGAGTFSDGKLNTLVKDRNGRNSEVLRLFKEFGAQEEILYDAKPHMGTDILQKVVKNMREEIIHLGGKVYFESQVTDLVIKKGRISGVVVNHINTIKANVVILAIGHSARNTFEMLYRNKIPMEAKSFAVGLRTEHSQKMINESQYGVGHVESLPAAPYKIAARTKDGRGVYSFCMCPGGYVVNASSEDGRLCVNGMSYSDRDGQNANSAIIVSVTPDDFGSDHPLAGLEFQRRLEENSYKAGKGKVPVQTYQSFKVRTLDKKTVNADVGATFLPTIKGEYIFADLTGILPEAINRGIVEGVEQAARGIKGFNRPDSLLSAVESRTSSPVRILRDEKMNSVIEGLYPCGEGAGYAGGITSAAIDGIKVAEAVASAYKTVKHPLY